VNRGALLALGLVSLGGAAALAPPAASGSGTVVSALGRSMGGLRIACVDALFLRAEALRPIHDWVSEYEQLWADRLDRLDGYLEEVQRRDER